MYDTFLTIKADFNPFVPFNRDPAVLNDIVNKVLKKLHLFHRQHENEMGNDLRNMLVQMAEETRNWKKDL